MKWRFWAPPAVPEYADLTEDFADLGLAPDREVIISFLANRIRILEQSGTSVVVVSRRAALIEAWSFATGQQWESR